MPLSLLRPQPVQRHYLAFLGRISREKGIEAAISIARATGIKLKIAAKVDQVDRDYFEYDIKPQVDGSAIEYIGEIKQEDKEIFLSGAHALLFPIAWPEPFGLSMIEAMACGTPVIGFNLASVPEVIDNGVTGFVVTNEKEAVTAVRNLDQLDRKRVRSRFEERFSVHRMVEDYIGIYTDLLSRASKR